MNKIFKVIWSKTKQCYVVVSEVAKNRSGKKKIVVASILAALAMTQGVVDVQAIGSFSGNSLDSSIAISLTKTSISAGNQQITNVASGGTTESNAATIGDVKSAVENLSQNLKITDGTTTGTVDLKNQSLKVTGTGTATATVDGQAITVNVAEGTLTPNTADGTVTGTAGVAKAADVATAINNTNSVLGNKITTNATNIATNTANIATNKANIATNTADIANTISLV